MHSISEAGIDFKSFEQQCYDVGMAFARMLMTDVLTDLDNKILDTRDKREYRAKDVRPLTIKTLMGEVTVKRRLYLRTAADGRREHVHLLDKAINLDTIGKMSVGLVHRTAEVVTECSYRATAAAVSFMSGQSISPGGVWNAVQAAGERICEADESMAKAAKNFLCKGKKIAKVLQEEFDGVWINMQGKDKPKSGRKSEMKLSSAYEGVVCTGKDKNGKPTYDSVNPVYTAGFESAAEFFWKKEGQIGSVYDLNEIDTRLINGDGGGWVRGFGERSGCEHHFQLDPFHVKRALFRSGISEEERGKISELLEQKNTGEALGRLEALYLKETDGDRKKRIGKAFGYLNGHRESLVPVLKRGLALPAPADGIVYGGMGSTESTVCGVIALRMKKRRASFTKSGATKLARLLCLKRSGKLDEAIVNLSKMSLPFASRETVTAVLSAAKTPREDGKGFSYPRAGGLPFAGARTTNGRNAIKDLCSCRRPVDLVLR
jgi:hypothetical protein